MKFGAVDIDAPGLQGSILAHTLRLKAGGGAVKKGAILSRHDIDRLKQSLMKSKNSVEKTYFSSMIISLRMRRVLKSCFML